MQSTIASGSNIRNAVGHCGTIVLRARQRVHSSGSQVRAMM
jgi:hypothetical protein